MAQPKIKFDFEPPDLILEIVGAIGILFLIGTPSNYYDYLPDIIPQHYNLQGEADGFGTKGFIWILPGLGLLLYFGLSILNKYPNIFNYPQKITPENARAQYKIATRLIRLLNTTIVWIFCYLSFSTIQSALGHQSGPGKYFTLVFLVLILGPISIYLFISARAK